MRQRRRYFLGSGVNHFRTIESLKGSLVLFGIAILAFSSCSDLGTAPPVERSLDDIREAVFRHQFLHNASGLQQDARVYFIGFYVPGDSLRQGYYLDPSDQLLTRFEGNVPPVKRFSACRQSITGVFDIQTGARGLLFRIESVTEIKDNEAEVTGGYFEAGLSASGNVYTVRWADGRWTVVGDHMIWIS